MSLTTNIDERLKRLWLLTLRNLQTLDEGAPKLTAILACKLQELPTEEWKSRERCHPKGDIPR
jgi:hypothetical protein